MKAIILAAGYATRLYPLTKDRPKALLPVAGKPIIDYIVEQINRVEAVNAIYVVSNHKFADAFEAWAKDHKSPQPIKVIDDGTTTEDTRLGAIGDIHFLLEKEGIDEEVMIIAGDNLFTFDLLAYYRFFKEKDADCVCAKSIEDIETLKQFAVAVINGENQVTRLVEKPEVPPSSLGVFATYMYKKETVRLFRTYLAEGNKPDAPGYFVQWLYPRKEVYVYIMDGECYDIGTPRAYEEVQRLFG